MGNLRQDESERDYLKIQGRDDDKQQTQNEWQAEVKKIYVSKKDCAIARKLNLSEYLDGDYSSTQLLDSIFPSVNRSKQCTYLKLIKS